MGPFSRVGRGGALQGCKPALSSSWSCGGDGTFMARPLCWTSWARDSLPLSAFTQLQVEGGGAAHLKASVTRRVRRTISRSIVVSIRACHARGPGSIPGARVFFLFLFCFHTGAGFLAANQRSATQSALLAQKKKKRGRLVGAHKTGSKPARNAEQQKMPTSRIELLTFCLLGRRSAN